MRTPLLAVLLAAVLLPGRTSAQSPADAYLDARARELVAAVRERRRTVDLSIDEYRARSTDRFSVGHRLLGRERLLVRRETATRIHWRREGPIDLEVLGAREASAVAGGGVEVPGDLDDYFHVAFDPLDSEFLFSLDRTMVRHPFADGSEEHYRFATGDSSAVRLPDGTEVNLREVRVIPRRSDPQLVAGSFWLHTETSAVVQATFKPADVYRVGMTRADSAVSVTVAPSGRVKVPFFLKAIQGEITQITVDYGLWELRWWLPRYVRVAGVLQAGALGALTLQYELGYADYEIEADTTRVRAVLDSAAFPCLGVRRLRDVTVASAPDSLRAAWERKAAVRRGWRSAAADTAAERCLRQYRVSAPASEDSLLASEFLPPSIFAPSEVIADVEAEQLALRIARLPRAGWGLGGAALEWGLTRPDLVRYNRVEGLSPAVGAALPLGRGELRTELRYGIADEMPKGRVDLLLQGRERDYLLSGYRDLRAAEGGRGPFSLGNSLRALLFGYDEALYYRATGAALQIGPDPARYQGYSLRLYAEHQAAVRKNTDWSLPHLFDGDQRFADNITADRARQVGAEAMLQRDFGANPRAFRLGIRSGMRAETGTFEFVRPELGLRLNVPALGPISPALEAAAGTTFGTSPTQSFWYLGGTRTLRGYPVRAAEGPAYWRARGELGTAFPAVRLTLFSDLGWAGSAEGTAWRTARPLWSAGAGVSFFDGILRADVARALRAPTGWGLHFYLGGLQ